MEQPPRSGSRRDVALATNAPAGWPTILAAGVAADGESVDGHVARLRSAVAAGLREAGMHVVDVDRRVLVGQQIVKVDVVADVGGVEIPIFVFPGVDADREGAMFTFLRAAIAETETFAAPPLYYAVDELRFTGRPSRESVERLGEAFADRARDAGVRVTLASSAAEVVAAVRALAGAPVEAGGGDTVLEAAAFVGEWLRAATGAQWVLRDDLPRSVLFVRDTVGATQWHLPVFAWFPDAVRTGYDGLLPLLERLERESARDTDTTDMGDLPLSSDAYRREGQAWIEETLLAGEDEESAYLLRRCSVCGEMSRSEVEFSERAPTPEAALARTLSVQSAPVSPCEDCGAVDYREAAFLYLIPKAGSRALIVAEFFDSHVQVATRELAMVPL